jgi:hypothetical protein
MATRLRASSALFPVKRWRLEFPLPFLTPSCRMVSKKRCDSVSVLAVLDAIKGLLTEIAEGGQVTKLVLKHHTGFMLGLLSGEK